MMNANVNKHNIAMIVVVLTWQLVASGLIRAENIDATNLIKNPGVEAKVEDWSIHVYGSKPEIEFDEKTVHEGKRSLRITATEVGDIALGQDIPLKPRQCYRFTGWVRTSRLDPHG